jgi:multiple sugar transport system permease protein
MSWPRRAVLHATLLLAAAIVLVPFLWTAAAAFKRQIVLLTGQVLFQPTLANFAAVLNPTSSDYPLNFANSLIIGLASTALALFVATLAAYTLRHTSPPRWIGAALLGWSALFQMLPPITFAGAWYQMFRFVSLDNTYPGLILAHATLNLPIVLWIMLVFVRDVPAEILEAARIDGATNGQILCRIVVPLVRPGLAAAGILAFIFSWNEFVVTLTLSQRQTATVPIAIGKYAQQNTIDYTSMAAAAMLATIPAILLLLAAQRLVVRGLTAGALK